HVELTAIVVEFLDRDEALGLQSGVDDDEVVVDAHHFGRDDLALAHLLARQGFLEQLGKTLGRGCGCGCSSQCGTSDMKTRRTADSCARPDLGPERAPGGNPAELTTIPPRRAGTFPPQGAKPPPSVAGRAASRVDRRDTVSD